MKYLFVVLFTINKKNKIHLPRKYISMNIFICMQQNTFFILMSIIAFLFFKFVLLSNLKYFLFHIPRIKYVLNKIYFKCY